MQYNVAQLLKEPVGSTRTYRVDESVSRQDGAFHVLQFGQVFMMRTDKGIWVDANLKVRAGSNCGRCLKRFQQSVPVVIEEEYLPSVDVSSGHGLDVSEGGEGIFTIDEQHMLDLQEAIRQYTITNQPMKPLCQDACQGLCPDCGTNRNDETCRCQERALDPRWASLLNLQQGN